MHKALVLGTEQWLRYFGPEAQLVQRKMLMKAKWWTEFVPNHLFYISMVNETNIQIRMPKYMVIGQARNALCTIVDAEVASHQPQINSPQEMNTVDFIARYWSPESLKRRSKMRRSTVNEKIAFTSSQITVNSSRIFLRCWNHTNTCGMDIFESSSQLLIALKWRAVLLTHTRSEHHTGLKAWESEKEEMYRMLEAKVVKRAQTQLLSSVVLVPERLENYAFA